MSYKDVYLRLDVWEKNLKIPTPNKGIRLKEFNKEYNNSIQYLINEFNLKKNAKVLKKTKQNNTGKLNLKKIYSHKITDNVFKSLTVVENEQSHGLVFFLDWSGSMINIFNDVIKQLLIMVFFCRKLNIPFEVYAFTSEIIKENTQTFEERTVTEDEVYVKVNLNNFTLMNLLSSKMTQKELNSAADRILDFDGRGFSSIKGYYGNYTPTFFRLSCTPLNETIILAMDLIPKFKSANNVDKCHTMFLTDGDSTYNNKMLNVHDQFGGRRFSLTELSSPYYSRNNKFLYTRTKTKTSQKSLDSTHSKLLEDSTKCLMSILTKDLDDNVIFFKIAPSHKFNQLFGMILTESNFDKHEEFKLKFNKSGVFSVDSWYNTKTIVVNSKHLNLTKGIYEITNDLTTKKISSVFKKTMSTSRTNKIFIQELIKEIL